MGARTKVKYLDEEKPNEERDAEEEEEDDAHDDTAHQKEEIEDPSEVVSEGETQPSEVAAQLAKKRCWPAQSYLRASQPRCVASSRRAWCAAQLQEGPI